VDNWIDGFIGIAGTDTLIYVIGNKTDLVKSRVVPQSEGEEWAASRGVSFFETSAKTGDNVSAVFTALGKAFSARPCQPIGPSRSILAEQTNERNCC
jgi:GTPase SAR1 family protein